MLYLRDQRNLRVNRENPGQVIDATRRGIDPAGFYGLECYLNAQAVELADVESWPVRRGIDE